MASRENRKQIDFMAAGALICARAVRPNVTIINCHADAVFTARSRGWLLAVAAATGFISVPTTVWKVCQQIYILGARMVIVVSKLQATVDKQDISSSANAVSASVYPRANCRRRWNVIASNASNPKLSLFPSISVARIRENAWKLRNHANFWRF